MDWTIGTRYHLRTARGNLDGKCWSCGATVMDPISHRMFPDAVETGTMDALEGWESLSCRRCGEKIGEKTYGSCI